ncbi:MAG: hypothetical protein KA945_05700 [Zoogloea sp.]|nr:hypothetical protein [Zoogloea sp.]
MKNYALSLPTLSILTAVGCAGCASHTTLSPGTTLGDIQVSGVRVSSRERMVNDRLERSAFLAAEVQQVKELKEAHFGPQGITSLRSFTGLAASLGLNLDAGGAKLFKREKARDAQRLQNQMDLEAADIDTLKALRKKVLDGLNDGSITPEKAKGMLEAIKAADPGTVSKVGSLSPSFDDASKLRTELQKLIESISQVQQPGLDKLQGSPIDLFRDKLALLEELRSEQIAVELDERHDLQGGTLLRLSADSTVIPYNDSSAWGIVEMEVKPVFDQKLFTPEGFVDRLNDLAASRVVRAKRQYVTACYGKTLGVDQERTSINMLRRFAITERKLSAQKFVFNLPKRVSATNKRANWSATTPEVARDEDILELDQELEKARYTMAAAARDGKGGGTLCSSDFEKMLMPIVSRIFPAEIWGSTLSLASSTADMQINESSLDLSDAVWMQKIERKISETSPPPPGGTQKSSSEKHFRFVAPDMLDPAQHDKRSNLETWLGSAKRQVSTQTYAYAATPKEQVQRIAQNGSRRDAMELMLALQAVSGAGSASGAISMMQVNEAISSTLHRQPLVVGYSRQPENINQDSRTFGWVIGPRFKITEDWRGRPEFGFRHRMVQNTLSAEVVVPSLAMALDVKICTSWRPEAGDIANTGATENRSCRSERVLLPQSEEALAETFDPDARRPLPELYARRLVPLTTASGGTAVLLQGTNLWRNPQVYVGGLKASAVSVTSDMRGLTATFDAPLKDLDCDADRIVTVVTSTGSVDFGQMDPPGKNCQKDSAAATDTKTQPPASGKTKSATQAAAAAAKLAAKK